MPSPGDQVGGNARDLDHQRFLIQIGDHDPAARARDADHLAERPHGISQLLQHPAGAIQ